MTSDERSKVMVLLLLIHCLLLPPIVFFGDLYLVLVYCALLIVVPSFVTISLGKRELVGLL